MHRPGSHRFSRVTRIVRPGGITAVRWLRGYSDALQSSNLNELEPATLQYPSTPVIDEAGDGRIADESTSSIPIGNPESFLDDLPVHFSDNYARSDNLLFNATVEHQKNTLVKQFVDSRTRYFDSPFPAGDKTLSYLDTSAGAMLGAIIERQISRFEYWWMV